MTPRHREVPQHQGQAVTSLSGPTAHTPDIVDAALRGLEQAWKPGFGYQKAGVLLRLFVQPRASRNEIVGAQGEELKLRLTSPPVDGAANRLCCEFLAKELQVAKSAVELVGGESSRHKRLLVHGVDLAAVVARLAVTP